MASSLYLVVTTALLLFALAVAIPVLVGIAREGVQRHRQWKSGEMEPYTEDEEFDAGPGATTTDARICPHCGAENGLEFRFCHECTQPL